MREGRFQEAKERVDALTLDAQDIPSQKVTHVEARRGCVPGRLWRLLVQAAVLA